jgi:glucose-1-phosphate adenylyltransferase
MSPVELSIAVRRSLAIVMGGGAGTRLFPLTKDRSKPAVPLAGKYRLVDIPISNCLNAGLRQIYVLTQFNSASLHRHIHASYKFDHFSRSFVEILAAQQTPQGSTWYQGTADAVRQNMRYFLQSNCDYFFILSGDQLYRMDYRLLLERHITSKADITIATLPVQREAATAFGIMHTDDQSRIIRFEEKPKDPALLDQLRMPPAGLKAMGKPEDAELFQASMGIYVFNKKILVEALDNDMPDFGKHLIPAAINKYNVFSYVFEGYWEDIGTIRSFYEANLALTDVVPPFSFFDSEAPIYTHPRFLPASKINSATIRNSIISDGCIVSNAHIERSVIGVRSVINSGATVRDSILMGADGYDCTRAVYPDGMPPLGIGRNSVVERAIVDKNARIGEGVVITPEGKPENLDGENFYVRDGIVVIPKDAVIPDGAWI